MPLAKGDDPYILGNGTLVEPIINNHPISHKDIKETRKILPIFATIVPTKTVDTDNIPEPDGQQQTVISAVVAMRLIGLSDVDIADLMQASLDQVQQIVKLPATQATFEMLYRNIIHANSENIQGRIASHANAAVDVVVSMMNNKETRDDVRLKAAQDVLDRSGANAEQFFGETSKSNQNDDELRIVIMNDEEKASKMTVEVTRRSK